MAESNIEIDHSPTIHPLIGFNPTVSTKLADVAVDVVYIEGVPILHTVDKFIGYSEAIALSSRRVAEQARRFAQIWIHKFGLPHGEESDRVYKNKKFTFYSLFT